MGNLVDRMVRAAKLDVQLYEEVEKDQTAMPQAMAVVAISSLAGGVGSLDVAGSYPSLLARHRAGLGRSIRRPSGDACGGDG